MHVTCITIKLHGQTEGENELLVLLRQDDRKAFDQIFSQYWPQLYIAAIKRLADPEISKDIVQEVFISVWERRKEMVIQNSLQAYLLSAVKFKVIDYFRKAITLDKHKTDLLKLTETSYMMDAIETTELEDQVASAIRTLPEKMRKIFEMSRTQGKSIAEISAELNVSSQTVKNQLSHAVRILRKQLVIGIILASFIFR